MRSKQAPNQSMTSTASGRRRSKLACQTCRDLKRKCDGAQPCGTCVRFDYKCAFQEGIRKRRKQSIPAVSAPASRLCQEQAVLQKVTSAQAQSSLEANSGPAFVRKLALRLDPKKTPRTQTFAWNAFLGSRRAANLASSCQTIAEMIPKERMQELAAVYFEQVSPTYGFVDQQEVLREIERRWASASFEPAGDAVLCGIAALGSLFSLVQANSLEQNMVETARVFLERTMSEVPGTTIITAWLLRVVYLRLAGTHYESWMASCMVMHMIEAAGLLFDYESDTAPIASSPGMDADAARRLVLVAQHLNLWMSFDMGLTRVALASAMALTMPDPRPGDFTIEITELLAFSVDLDPERKPTGEELTTALHAVMDRVHSIAPTILAQCNLALCLCRRLRSMETGLSDAILRGVLNLTTSGIKAARTILAARAPWHHMAYVPFQIVCVLLAIDTVTSISQLRDAMQCLRDISLVYDTQATQDALATALSLVRLHQKGKTMFASALSDVLEDHKEPVCNASLISDLPSSTTEVGSELNIDLCDSPCLDLEPFLDPGFFWNAGSNGII